MSDEILRALAELKAGQERLEATLDKVESDLGIVAATVEEEVTDLRKGMSEGFSALQDSVDAIHAALKTQKGGNPGPRAATG
jgi:hypothetical protein